MKSNTLGSTSNPNSALFNVNQIASILLYGSPNFGVYGISSSFASLNFINNSNQIYFNFSQGQVFYNQNIITIPSQSIPVTSSSDTAGIKYFKFYLDYNDFSLSSQVFSFTIISVSGNTIVVNNLPTQSYLNNFLYANINNYLFNIASININTNTIVFNQNVSSFAFANSTITLIYQPIIKYITTFAITGTPPDIDIPSTGIILATAYVNISGTSSLSYSCPQGVTTAYQPYLYYSNPSNFFPSQSAYNAFFTSINNAIKTYNTVKNYNLESQLLISLVSYTSGISSSQYTFDQFWHLQPYQPTSLFQYGIGYQNLQKVDFDPRFKNFWYFYKNKDLTRTYAIFRGDIYGGNAIVGQSLGSFPGTTSVSNLVDFTGNSTTSNGTYSYGVSAVNPSGEYNPLFSSNSNFYFNLNVNNYISWTSSTPISNLLFFHVYRNIQSSNGFQQARLTNPFQIPYYTLNDTILSNISTYQSIGSSNFAFQIKTNGITSGIIGGISFNAFISDPTALTGIQSCIIVQSGSNYISPYVVISGNGIGAAVSLTTTSGGGIGSALITSFGSGYTQTPVFTIFDSATNSGGSGAQIQPILSQLNCGIYTGTSTSPSGIAITALQSIPIASITSSYIMNMPVTKGSFVGLNSNTYYWAVFNMNTPYTLTLSQNINFLNSTGYTGTSATSYDGKNWISGITSSQIAKLGFLDQGINGTVTSSRGVYLTNDQAAYPSRLQIFVPNLDLSSLGFNDVGYINGGTIVSTSPIQNSMTVYVIAQNSTTGIQTTLSGSLPEGTARGTTILLGGTTDLYDTVLDVFVVPNISAGVNFVSGTTAINWTIYDMFTIDSVP
jgi:hypothetical protein